MKKGKATVKVIDGPNQGKEKQLAINQLKRKRTPPQLQDTPTEKKRRTEPLPPDRTADDGRQLWPSSAWDVN